MLHLAPGEVRRYRLEIGALAGNLDLLTRELLRPVRPAAGRTPEEVPDGKR